MRVWRRVAGMAVIALVASTVILSAQNCVVVNGATSCDGAWTFLSTALFSNGSASAPSIAFSTNPLTGLFYGGTSELDFALNGTLYYYLQPNELSMRSSTASITWGSGDVALTRTASGALSLSGLTLTMLQFGGTTSSFPALKRSGTSLQVRLADDSGYATLSGQLQLGANSSVSTSSGKVLLSDSAPTISSGFGTGASIVASNGSTAFTLNVGTGGTATSGVIGLPTATTGWNCFATDRTTLTDTTRESATTTTTVTLTATVAWTASDILQVSCFAY